MALPYSSDGCTNAVNNFVTINESRCSNDLLIIPSIRLALAVTSVVCMVVILCTFNGDPPIWKEKHLVNTNRCKPKPPYDTLFWVGEFGGIRCKIVGGFCV